MHLGEFSIICFEFLGDFWRKSQKEKRRKNWAKKKIGPLRRSEGPEKAPSGSPRRNLATPRQSASPQRRHCSQRQNFWIFVPKT